MIFHAKIQKHTQCVKQQETHRMIWVKLGILSWYDFENSDPQMGINNWDQAPIVLYIKALHRLPFGSQHGH